MKTRIFDRALIVDGDEVWLKATKRILMDYGVASVVTAQDLASGRRQVEPGLDLLVCEVVLGGQRCFPLLSDAAALEPFVPVIAISDRAPRAQVFRLNEYGVVAYFEKPLQANLLVRCLDDLADGRPAATRPNFLGVGLGLGELTVGRLVEDVLTRYRSQLRFTSAELEVLRCALAGMSRPEIARERAISINTVKTQVRALLSKSGYSTMHELLRSVQEDVRRSDIRETRVSTASPRSIVL